MKKGLIIALVVVVIAGGIGFWWYRKNYAEITAKGSDASGNFIKINIGGGPDTTLRVGSGTTMGLSGQKTISFDGGNNLIIKDKSGNVISSTPFDNIKLGKI